MRLIFLLIAAFIIALVVSLQLKLLQRYVAPALSPDSPTNVNTQLQNTQQQVDTYNQKIEEMQNQTDDALKTTN